MNIKKLSTSFLLIFVPLISNAQILAGATTFSDVTRITLRVVYYLMQSVFALITLGIIFVTLKYINALRTGDKAANEYRKILVGSIIGLAVAFSLWGLITVISNTLGWNDVGIPILSAPSGN